jgi:ABC-type amino acid transport system permease subunit
MERIIEQIPRFFTLDNMVLLAQSAGLTLAMTAMGCLIGFGLAFVLVYLRQTPGLWALPLRAICIAYVEIFRRIPFIVVIYLVLFFIQTLRPMPRCSPSPSLPSAFTQWPTPPTLFAAASSPWHRHRLKRQRR